MKNKILKNAIFLAVFLLVSLKANVALGSFKIPDQVTIEEHYFALTSSFDIVTDIKIGLVKRKIFSLKLEYDFYDFQDNLNAKGRLRWLNIGAVFDVTDREDKPLGSIREHIFTLFPTFDIFSPSGEKLAVVSLNFFGTKYTFRDPITHKEIATLTRPFFRLFKDKWTLKISDQRPFNELKINSSMFMLIAVFQTDRDYWESLSDNNIKSPKHQASSFVESIKALRREIDFYHAHVEEVEPIKDDLYLVNEMVDARLSNASQMHLVSEQERIIYGLNMVIPLLESGLLTPPQKYGLTLLIEQKVQELEKSL